MSKLLNLTPHEIRVAGQDGEIITIPASGLVARCAENHSEADPIECEGVTVQTVTPQFGYVHCIGASGEKLPFPQASEGVFLIVSLQVQTALVGRSDVITVFKFNRERNCAEGFCRNPKS